METIELTKPKIFTTHPFTEKKKLSPGLEEGGGKKVRSEARRLTGSLLGTSRVRMERKEQIRR